MKRKIIVTRRWPEPVERLLADKFDAQLNTSDQPFDLDQMRDALCSFDAVLTTVTDHLGAEVFDVGKRPIKTKIIANYGVGYSHIDTDAANQAGITITNTPDVLSECTADIAIMLMLVAARRGGEGERELRSGQWSGWRPTHMIGEKVSNATLGIVGFGRIGRETAKRALGFNMKVRVFNRSKVDPTVLQQFNAQQVDTLEELAGEADFLSLHCPGGEPNTNLINKKVIAAMKPTGYLINTARGEVVDESALLDALENNEIGGAGLDVFVNEPALNPRFAKLDNAVLLPHLGSASAETRNAMGFRCISNLEQFFADKTPDDRVS